MEEEPKKTIPTRKPGERVKAERAGCKIKGITYNHKRNEKKVEKGDAALKLGGNGGHWATKNGRVWGGDKQPGKKNVLVMNLNKAPKRSHQKETNNPQGHGDRTEG